MRLARQIRLNNYRLEPALLPPAVSRMTFPDVGRRRSGGPLQQVSLLLVGQRCNL